MFEYPEKVERTALVILEEIITKKEMYMAQIERVYQLVKQDRERVERAIAVLRDGTTVYGYFVPKTEAVIAILEGRES